MVGPNKITLEIIVNGAPTSVEVNQNAPLHSAIGRALQQTGNQGEADRWEFRDANGNLIDSSQKVEDLELEPGARLFLNLRAGVAG